MLAIRLPFLAKVSFQLLLTRPAENDEDEDRVEFNFLKLAPCIVRPAPASARAGTMMAAIRTSSGSRSSAPAFPSRTGASWASQRRICCAGSSKSSPLKKKQKGEDEELKGTWPYIAALTPNVCSRSPFGSGMHLELQISKNGEGVWGQRSALSVAQGCHRSMECRPWEK